MRELSALGGGRPDLRRHTPGNVGSARQNKAHHLNRDFKSHRHRNESLRAITDGGAGQVRVICGGKGYYRAARTKFRQVPQRVPQTSLPASIKERTTSSAETSWCWAPSSDNVEYVATVADNAECTLRRMHSSKNGRLSIIAIEAAAFVPPAR